MQQPGSCSISNEQHGILFRTNGGLTLEEYIDANYVGISY